MIVADQGPKNSREDLMRKYLLASALIVAFSAPAFAEQFYVAFDPASHKCTMMHDIPGDKMKNMGGPYNSKEEAEKAMAGMEACAK
jgi:hypothetical protein